MARPQFKRSSFEKKVSKKLNKALNKEMDNFKAELKPSNVYSKSAVHLSQSLINEPYHNSQIEILPCKTGEKLTIYDHDNEVVSIYTREYSNESSEQHVIQLFKDLKKDITEIQARELLEAEDPEWKMTEMGINIHGDKGVFLNFGSDHQTLRGDYLPCLLTDQEAVISSPAVYVLGGNSYIRGGQVLMMLNSIASAKFKGEQL